MKRTVLFLLLTIPILVFGQGHMKFLAHPICGDMKPFVELLKADGFTVSVKKSWFKKMKTKYLKGDFWWFPNCDIVIRQPKGYKQISSVYVHPHNNYLRLDDLIGTLDEKYGSHQTYCPSTDPYRINYSWDLPEGSIVIFASTVYGQSFDILYQDWTERTMIQNAVERIDADL